MAVRQDIKIRFLKQFIKRAILSSHPTGKPVSLPKLEIEIKKAVKPILKKPQPVKKPMIASPRPVIRPIPEPIAKPAPTPVAQIPGGIKLPILDRLRPLLLNPQVVSVNCPGPNQNLIVTYIGGRTQTFALTFTAKEIEEFVRDISARTKIPLTPGLFKVAFQNLILTAVVSEFIGNKFILEKRAPAAPLVHPVARPAKAKFI